MRFRRGWSDVPLADRERKVRGGAACEYRRDRVDLRSAEQPVHAELAADLGRAQTICRFRRNDLQVGCRTGCSDGVSHPAQFVPRQADILEADVANAERTDLLQKLEVNRRPCGHGASA